MKPVSAAAGIAGLLLLAAAAWLVPAPRPQPRPDLPEIPPFRPGERIALFIPDPENFPPANSFGLTQRARAAGAEVRVFAPGESRAEYAPDRCYQPSPRPGIPAGYHPDQWPHLPPGERNSDNDWQMLVLTPAEMAVRNAAILAAAHALRATGTDDARGTQEAALLSRARRAEIYLPLPP